MFLIYLAKQTLPVVLSSMIIQVVVVTSALVSITYLSTYSDEL